MNTNDIPFDRLQRIQAEMQPGESIRWIGQPSPKSAALGGAVIWLFAIPWTAFALFWMCGAAGFKIPDFKSPQALFPLFGLPFVLVGVAMLLSPIALWRKAKRTYYMVTDRRAVILLDGATIKVQSFGPKTLSSVERVQSPDGSGSLFFGDTAFQPQHGKHRPPRIGFIGIPNVREVESLLAAVAEPKS
jgi:hypothetical protein